MGVVSLRTVNHATLAESHFTRAAALHNKNAQQISIMKNSFVSLFKSALAALLVTFTAVQLPSVARAEWVTEGNVTTFVDQVGFSPDGSKFSGTVALRMESVTVSGQFKIITTITGIIPEPGFTYVVRKSGGVNGTVEIEFNSANASSRFSFLYKPGVTKIDYGVMRER